MVRSNQESARNPQELGEVITFYSYKGGTGRTMALANIACLLVEQPPEIYGKGVLMIDWDLEAPSLHRYFRDSFTKTFENENNPDYAFERYPGLIDLFETIDNQIDETLFERELRDILNSFQFDDFILNTDIPNLYFLKSGSFDEDYEERVSTFNWESLFERTQGLLFSLVAEKLASKYRYVLIDSRTGIADTSNICTMLMPEKLVLVFTPNRQSFTGLEKLGRNAVAYRGNAPNLFPLTIFPLPSRIELSEGYLREDWRFGNINNDIQGYQTIFEELLKSLYSLQECKLQKYFDEVQIQQSSRFSYGEEIAVWLERTNDSLSLTRSYQRFLKFLLKNTPWEEGDEKKDIVIDGITVPNVPPKSPEIVEIETLSSKSSNLRKVHDMLGALVINLKAIIRLQDFELDIKKRPKKFIPKNVKKRLIDRLIGICKNIREMNRFEGHGDDVWDIDVHPTGNLIISASDDRTLKLWKSDESLLTNFIGHDARIRSVCFSPNPDSKLIASASDDRTVRLWSLDGFEIGSLEGHLEEVLSVNFSPDGKLLASAGADRTIKLWKSDGTLDQSIDRAHGDCIWDVRFNPQGNLIASASDDHTVKLWNLDGELLKTFKESENKVYSICFCHFRHYNFTFD